MGGEPDTVIDLTVVCSGEDQEGACQVGRSEAAADEAERQVVEIGQRLGRDNGDACASVQETLGLAQGDFACADDEDRAVLEVEKNGIVSHPRLLL